jgi:nucleotide sugar dehydrogenase
LKILVIGLGKIGLPLAVYLAKNNQVVGLDNNIETVNQVNAGQEPFPGEKNLQEKLTQVVNTKNLIATTESQNAIKSADVILVCVPLIVNDENEPDFQNIDSVVLDIGNNLNKSTLVSFETTLPVGTTRDRFTRSIELASKYEVGKDFYVVFSPERVLTGRIFEDLAKYPKLVGGVTEQCTIKGVSFYKSVLDFVDNKLLAGKQNIWALKNCETAEFAKIAETTYRDVNIGLANEFAIYSKKKGIDFTEVIRAANSQPYSNIHSPGISVGGHCIPVYPYFYITDNQNSNIVNSARLQNSVMPQFVVNEIKENIASLNNLRIGILGITYRPGVKEVAFSGALDLLKLLKKEKAVVYGYDSYYTENEIINFGFNFANSYKELDGIIVHTAHPEFLEIDFSLIPALKFLYDGRNVYSHLKYLQNKFLYFNI